MSELIGKTACIDTYNVGTMERWLEECAENGLTLHHFRGTRGYFQRGEPVHCRYRLEPINLQAWRTTSEPDSAQQAWYAQQGWIYVTRYQRLFDVYSAPGQEGIAQLHTDPIVQAFAFDLLVRKVQGKLSICIAIWLVLLAAIFVDLFLSSTPVTKLASGDAWLGALVLSTLFLVGYVFDYLRARRVRNRLRQGACIVRPESTKKIRRRKCIGYYTLIILAVLITNICMFGFPGEQHNFDLPLNTPNLAELSAQSGASNWPEISVSSQIDRGVFMPVWLSIDENGGGETLIKNFYYLRFPKMAPVLLQEQIKKRGLPTEKLHNAHFDDAFFATDGEWQYFMIRSGRMVAVIEYRGKTSLRQVFPLFAQSLRAQ